MAAFRFLHRWTALVQPDDELADAVPLLEDRDRELEDYLLDQQGDANNDVITYATGGVEISYSREFKVAPVPVCNLEAPAAGWPHAAYIATPTTTGFTVIIYTGAGAEAAAGGSYRVYWHARVAGQ